MLRRHRIHSVEIWNSGTQEKNKGKRGGTRIEDGAPRDTGADGADEGSSLRAPDPPVAGRLGKKREAPLRRFRYPSQGCRARTLRGTTKPSQGVFVFLRSRALRGVAISSCHWGRVLDFGFLRFGFASDSELRISDLLFWPVL